MGWDLIKDAKKWFKKIENLGKGAEKKIKDGLDQIGNEAKNKAKWIDKKGKNTVATIENTGKATIGKVENAGKEIEKTFEKRIPELVTKEIPKALEKIVVDLSKELGKPGLKAAAKLARQTHQALVKFDKKRPGFTTALDSQVFTLQIKAVVTIGIRVSGMYTRGSEIAGVLDRYANEGLKPRRRDICGLVRVILPSSVSAGVEAELSLGFVAGASGTIMLTGELIVELLDLILDEAGVPA